MSDFGPWKDHDGRSLPLECELRVVEVEYECAPVKRETFFVDSSTWVEPGSAWVWGTWQYKIVRYRVQKPKEERKSSQRKRELDHV